MSDTLGMGKSKAPSGEPAEPSVSSKPAAVGGGGGGSGGNGSAGFTRSAAPKGTRVVGTTPTRVDPRLYGGLDYVAGYANMSRFEVGKDDRMSVVEASNMLRRILSMFSLNTAQEGDIFTFVAALWTYHTLNGSSVLGPSRAKIECLGNVFEYTDIATLLGNDSRRFFRQFADEVRKNNKRILDCDPNDVVAMGLREQLIQVAYDRGLQRFPDLAHDSADACTSLTPGEKAAVAASKRSVLSTGVNTADSLQAMSRVQGADAFDSTAGERVVGASGSVAGRRGNG